jgi:hypothetical protein
MVPHRPYEEAPGWFWEELVEHEDFLNVSV